MEQKAKGPETIVLPGTTTKSDFKQTLDVAAQIIADPSQFNDATRKGIGAAVQSFASQI